jgi:glutamate-ammonia-ligase adenylyltransferase
LPRTDYETLRDGYHFLRRLEQRIHVLHGAGSSIIDERSTGLAQLARRMGYEDTAGAAASRQLLDRYQDVTREVRLAYERVLGLA